MTSYGQKAAAHFEAEAEAMVQVPRKEEVTWRVVPEPDSPFMNVSLDGVMVNLLEEGWNPEDTPIKLSLISAVEPTVNEATGEIEVRLTHLLCFVIVGISFVRPLFWLTLATSLGRTPVHRFVARCGKMDYAFG